MTHADIILKIYLETFMVGGGGVANVHIAADMG